MLPPWLTLNQYPTVVLYSDGQMITLGPQLEIYPGPALPNLVVTPLTLDGVRQVLVWAAEAGLQGEDRFLGEPIPDAPVTTVIVAPPGERRHTTSVADMSAPDDATVDVARFQEILLNIRESLPNEVQGEDQPYAWDRLAVVANPARPEDQPDPALVTISQWPLADLASLGLPLEPVAGHRCAVIEGADLDALRPALATANELTLWLSEEQTYAVQFHPLLPDEPGCPELAGP